MNTRIHESMRDEKGFTLVELAIVMVIIGLLLGGILKGQEMIVNARVTSTVGQIKSYEAATSTFRDMYDAYPGDMINASTRLPNCTVNPCLNGDGSGGIDEAIGAAQAVGTESTFYFNHLRVAELISGFDGTAAMTAGSAVPAAAIGGNWSIGSSTIAGVQFNQALMRRGNYLTLTGSTAATADGSGILTPAQGSRIDNKIDDGDAAGGSVQGQSTANNCVNAGGDNAYEATGGVDQVCEIAIRING